MSSQQETCAPHVWEPLAKLGVKNCKYSIPTLEVIDLEEMSISPPGTKCSNLQKMRVSQHHVVNV